MVTTTGQKIEKGLFIISIGCILFWIMCFILFSFTPLEFSKVRYQTIYEKTRFWNLPLAILLTLTGTIKKKDNVTMMAARTGLTIIVSGLIAFILFMSVFANMCDWTEREILFRDRKNPGTRIVQREYGCGAWDSGSPIKKVFFIRNVAPFLVWATEIDTAGIDKQRWIRVERNE